MITKKVFHNIISHLNFNLLIISSILLTLLSLIWNNASWGIYRPTPSTVVFLIFLVILILLIIFKSISKQVLNKKKISLVDIFITSIFTIMLVLPLAFIVSFISAFFGNGSNISSTYNCGDKKISIIGHFKEGGDMYINHGLYLERITEITHGNYREFPYPQIRPTYQSRITESEKVKYASCIPAIDVTEYTDKLDPCSIYTCQNDGYKIDYNNLKNIPYPCIVKKDNGRVIQCADNYPPYNGDPEIINGTKQYCVNYNPDGSIKDRKEFCDTVP